MTGAPANGAGRREIEICEGCGERMTEARAVTVCCDEKGNAFEWFRLCAECAALLATGTARERIDLFERAEALDMAFFVCECVEKQMAVH